MPLAPDPWTQLWAAKDLGKEPGSFEIAGMHPRKLIAMAARGEMGLAICTYRDRKTPVYAILPGSLVKAVAKELEKG